MAGIPRDTVCIGRSPDFCRHHAFSIRAVKIRIKTDKRQVELFRCDILVCIVKIEPERRGYYFDPGHVTAAKPENGNPAIAKKIPDKLREEAGGIFLVQDDPNRVKCQIRLPRAHQEMCW
jgi:hypothetical protein